MANYCNTIITMCSCKNTISHNLFLFAVRMPFSIRRFALQRSFSTESGPKIPKSKSHDNGGQQGSSSAAGANLPASRSVDQADLRRLGDPPGYSQGGQPPRLPPRGPPRRSASVDRANPPSSGKSCLPAFKCSDLFFLVLTAPQERRYGLELNDLFLSCLLSAQEKTCFSSMFFLVSISSSGESDGRSSESTVRRHQQRASTQGNEHEQRNREISVLLAV